MELDQLVTPALILDRAAVARNTERMGQRMAAQGIALRPHLKTSKSMEVAKIAKDREMSGITVSTLKEAEYFAANGFSDIMLAAAITPNKFCRIRDIHLATGQSILLVTDNLLIANAAVSYAAKFECDLALVIEVDCGEHRSGLPFDSPEIIEISQALVAGERTLFKGIMTHAGHSYLTSDRQEIENIAEMERKAAVQASLRLADAGMECEIISIGSTPTFLMAKHLEGITEVRAGIYLFWDLAQYSRKICQLDDIALSVLSTVIGHNRMANSIILDAGALAMSKDTGANANLPDAKFGYVCDPQTLDRIGTLSIDAVHQEHGTVILDDHAIYQQLPVGSLVRILPNHACLTAAPYGSYTVIEDGEIIGEWACINGWLGRA